MAQVVKVSTKVDKDSDAKETVLTVDFDSPQAERALALQALVVKWQGNARRNGIPATASIKVSEYAPGTRHSGTPDVKALFAAMTPEERAALIAQYK